MNFKGVQSLWKKSGKFTNILCQHDLQKCGFSWAHLYAKIGVLINASKRIDSKKEMSLNLKFKPHGTYNTNQTSPGYHSSFNIVVVTITPGVSQPC
jgi:hypothetical protein